jgi:hypothetical protein
MQPAAVGGEHEAGEGNPMSLMQSRAVRPISPQAQAVLDWVHAHLVTNREWPTFAPLDAAMDRSGLDAYAGLQELDEHLIRGNRFFNDDSRVELSIDGIAAAHQGEATIALFLRILSICVDLERRWTQGGETGPCTLQSEHLASVMTPDEVRLSFELLTLDHWINGGSGSNTETGTWQLTLNKRGVRRYRGVASWEEYVSARDGTAGASPSSSSATVSSVAAQKEADENSSAGSTVTTSPAPGGMTTQEIMRIVNRYIGVHGGYLGDFSYRTHADFYPEYCGLSLDPNQFEGTTRERFIAILSSLGARDQAKVVRGVLDRFPLGEGPPSRTQEAREEVRGIVARLESGAVIATSSLRVQSDLVSRALADAETLLASSGPASAVDRVHTALHGYLRDAVEALGLQPPKDASMTALFKILRKHHPRLAASVVTSADQVDRILASCTNILDAMNALRNNASVAHPNRQLLDDPEAHLAIHVGRSLLAYLDAKLS